MRLWTAWRKRLIYGAAISALTTVALAISLAVPIAPAHAASTAQNAYYARLVKQLSVGGVLGKNGGYFTPPLPADYTPVDPTKLQPDIPAAFAGTKDPNGDPNYEAEIKVSLYPTDLAALDAKPAPTSGPFKVNPGDKLDVVRMKKNGGFPVIVSLPSQLTPSSISVPTEYTVWYKEPGCVQPPKGFDPGKATPQERNAYGYPPLHPGENVAAYDTRLNWMKERVCEYRMGNVSNAPLTSRQTATAQAAQVTNNASHSASISGNNPKMWNMDYSSGVPEFTGNFADEPCAEMSGNDYTCSFGTGNAYNYTDTWSSWILRGVSGTNTAVGRSTVWMGLGGLTAYPEYNDDPFALVQSGSENYAWVLACGTTTCNKYSLWLENVDGNNCTCNGAIFPWGQGSSNYNIRVYAEEWGYSNGTNAESEVGDETNGHWYSTNSFNGYNLGYDTETADAFQEVARSGGNPQFSSDTFNGLAVYEQTTLRTTVGFDNAWHDYFKSHGSCSNYNNTIGSLVYDGNYSPPVDNTITWANYC